MKKELSWIRFLVLLIVSLTFVFFCSNDSFADTWQEEGMCVSDGDYWNPEVVQLADGRYRMYYEYQEEGQLKSIYSLISSDGLTWEPETGVRVSDANMPSIVQLPDGRWRLYFNAAAQGGFGSALSEDGLNFIKEDGLRLTASGVGHETYGIRHPSVIRLDDGMYRMYYDARQAPETNERILSAISIDGLTWAKEAGVRIDYASFANCDSITTPDVIKTSDGYTRLYFKVIPPLGGGVTQGIYSALSADGLTFSVMPGPEIAEFVVDGQRYHIQDPTLVSIPTGLRMYYWIGMWGTLPLSGVYSATTSLVTPSSSTDSGITRANNGVESIWTFTEDNVSLGIIGVSPEAVLLDDASIRLYVTGGTQGMTLYKAGDGLTFTQETASLPLGGSDPTLIRLSDSTYRMYYNDREMIKTATSPDGLAWTEESSTGISNTNNNGAWGVPDSVKLPNGLIRLYWVDTPIYVTPPNGYEVVKSAISPDGLTFTEELGYRTEYTNGTGGWADPHIVLAEEGNWVGLFSYIPPFSETDTIMEPMTLHVGTSIDGLTWLIESEPIITVTGGHVGDPASYPLGDGSYRIYHVATSELNPPHTYFIKSGVLKKITTSGNLDPANY